MFKLKHISPLFFIRSFWMIMLFLLLGYSSNFKPAWHFLNIASGLVVIGFFSLLFNRILFGMVLTFFIAFLLEILNLVKKSFFYVDVEVFDLNYFLSCSITDLWGLIYLYMTPFSVLFLIFCIIFLFIFWYYSEPMIEWSSFSTISYLLLRSSTIAIAILLFSYLLKSLSSSHRGMGKYLRDHYISFVTTNPNEPRDHIWKNGLSKGFGPFGSIALSLPEFILKPINLTKDNSLILNYISKYNQDNNTNVKSKLPNVVLLLNESTINPYYLDYKLINEYKFDFFIPNSFTKQIGIMDVHTYGGGSWVSEFEAVSGINCGLFTSIARQPFITLVHYVQNSLFMQLKKLGYKTIVIYPITKKFLNAEYGYTKLGADLILDIHDFGYKPNQNWSEIYDSIIGDMILQTLKEHSDKPVFIFASTISNHGPHDSTGKYIQNQNNGNHSSNCENLDTTTCSKLRDYLNRLEKSSTDLTALEKALMDSGKPAIFFNFGDHMPSLEGNTLALKFKPEITDYYKTFYKISTNFDVKIPLSSYKVLDISFIPSLIIDIVGINQNLYYQASSAIREKCQGNIANCSNKYFELLESYKALSIEQIQLKY